jgi:hypothetical protein
MHSPSSTGSASASPRESRTSGPSDSPRINEGRSIACGARSGRPEAGYSEASRLGLQPGVALLRLAQGNRDAAAAIRGAVGESIQPLARAAFLPAYVEIMLAAGDVEAARSACHELDGIAERQCTDLLEAMAAQAEGSGHRLRATRKPPWSRYARHPRLAGARRRRTRPPGPARY